jgi:hypothetical protein
MIYLTRLGLAYNYISDIKPLETLKYIKELDVSHNLIGGEFKFNFTNVQKTLKEFDLSYNQITDITDILKYLDMKSGGNDGNYLSREDTININLNNQNIELTVEDPIYLDQYPNTVNINLPKIFTQLLAIDVNRTSFGETSQNGRVESEGKYVTLNTNKAGDKKGVVEVIAMSGNGSAVDTCVGKGTKATINYKVVERKVTKVTITEKVDMMKLGESAMFKAVVEGENDIMGFVQNKPYPFTLNTTLSFSKSTNSLLVLKKFKSSLFLIILNCMNYSPNFSIISSENSTFVTTD